MKPITRFRRSQLLPNEILDLEKELNFQYFQQSGDVVKATAKINYGQVDYLYDLYEQLSEQEELGKDYELVGELEESIDTVWEKDFKISIEFYYKEDQYLTIAVFDVFQCRIRYEMNEYTSKYFSGNLKELVEIWIQQIESFKEFL